MSRRTRTYFRRGPLWGSGSKPLFFSFSIVSASYAGSTSIVRHIMPFPPSSFIFHLSQFPISLLVSTRSQRMLNGCWKGAQWMLNASWTPCCLSLVPMIITPRFLNLKFSAKIHKIFDISKFFLAEKVINHIFCTFWITTDALTYIYNRISCWYRVSYEGIFDFTIWFENCFLGLCPKAFVLRKECVLGW